MANFVKLNNYRDVIYKIHNITNNKSSEELLKLINIIDNEVIKNNIGKELYTIINEIDDLIITSPNEIKIINEKISLTIHLIKKGYSVIHNITRDDLIKKLNISIKNRNSILKTNSPHGIIINLKPYSDFHFQTALLLKLQCKNCNKIWDDTKSIREDVFAPGNCNCYDIISIPWEKILAEFCKLHYLYYQ